MSEARYCHKCGNRIHADAAFCPMCGAKQHPTESGIGERAAGAPQSQGEDRPAAQYPRTVIAPSRVEMFQRPDRSGVAYRINQGARLTIRGDEGDLYQVEHRAGFDLPPVTGYVEKSLLDALPSITAPRLDQGTAGSVAAGPTRVGPQPVTFVKQIVYQDRLAAIRQKKLWWGDSTFWAGPILIVLGIVLCAQNILGWHYNVGWGVLSIIGGIVCMIVGRYYISSCNREIEQTLRAMEEEEKRP